MDAQIQIKSFCLGNLIEFLLAPYFIQRPPTYATSLDYGFDLDEEEVGQELASPSITHISAQPTPIIEAEEFDSLYKWFIS